MSVRISAKHIFNLGYLLSILGFSFAWSATREAFNLFVWNEYLGTVFWTAAMFFWFALFGVLYFGSIPASDAGMPQYFPWVCASVGIVGIALLQFATLLSIPKEGTLFFGILCICGSFAGLIRSWGEYNCALDIVEIVSRAAGALLFTCIVGFAIRSIDPQVQAALCALMYVLSAVGLWFSAHCDFGYKDFCASGSKEVLFSDFQASDASPRNLESQRFHTGRALSKDKVREPSRYLPVRWPWVLMSGVAIALFACGLIWAVTPVLDFDAWALGSLIGSAVLVLSTCVVVKRFPLNIFPMVSLALIQICILMILAGFFGEGFFITLLWLGHTFLWVWVLSVSCWQGSLEPTAPGRMVSRGMLLLVVSNLAGEVAGRFLPLDVSAILLLSAVMLVFAAEFIFGGARLFDRPLDVAEENAAKQSSERFREIAKRFSFTPREYDVFLLLRKGYSVKRISEELVVSDNTTKSHIRSLYGKMGVHSRQALIDLSEDLAEG